MIQKPLQSVLVKPAGPDCNLRCGYCFYLRKSEIFDQSQPQRMSIYTLQEVIRQVMNQGQAHVSFGWQGGEPTLMGLPFYEHAITFQQKYGRNQSVGNGLQTNGLLIDKKWARFLKSYNFLVGISIDGPEEIHNHYRTFKGGQGSWIKVINSANLLLDAGVAVNVLTVINDYSADFPEEIYFHHKNLGFDHMQFIPCIEPDPIDTNKSAAYSVSPEKYGRFLCKLFDLWHNDFKDGQPTTSIRHFDSLLHCYLELEAPECTQKETCGEYLVIEHNGDVYCCDFFVEPTWHLGNILSQQLVDMLNSSQQQRFGLQKSILEDQCKSCRWLKFCYGGCPKDRLYNQENNNLSAFCQSYQLFFEHADKVLCSLARDLKQASYSDTLDQGVGLTNQDRVGRNHPCPCGSGKKYKKCCGKLN
jgi:uncharacterized protein